MLDPARSYDLIGDVHGCALTLARLLERLGYRQQAGVWLHPQRMALSGVGALLCGPGWSADDTEADARAQIEVALRQLLPPEVSLDRWQRALVRCLVNHPAPELEADALAEGVAEEGAPGIE